MSFWDAASLAAAITIALIGFAANKILDVDFTVFFRRNWKRTKCKKMLAQRKGPWQGTNVQGEIRRAFDLVLLPLGKADKALLPARMDKNFRRRMEGQIELLQRRKLCRDIRMTDIVPLPKNSFRHWNDDGREWRESVLQCSALERLLSPKEGRPIYTIYRKNARLRLLQSRHVRSCDRAGKQTSCYAHKGTISCPSCGAEVELRSQQTVCPYCGYSENGPRIQSCLPPRSLIGGRYLAGKVLSYNGEGVTYIGYDTVSDRKVSVREFFPDALVTRAEDGKTVEVRPNCQIQFKTYLSDFLEVNEKVARLRSIS